MEGSMPERKVLPHRWKRKSGNTVEACDAKGGQSSRDSIPQIPVGKLAHQNRCRNRRKRGTGRLHLLGKAITLQARSANNKDSKG
jgi:hypothetical protein